MITFILSMLLSTTYEPIILAESQELASLATMMDKVPYNSVIPYILNKGKPVILISDLAQHTTNIKNCQDCSLMIFKPRKNPANAARITFIGKINKVESTKELQEIYLKKYPKSKNFINFKDFHFYQLEIDKIHYIGGFGDIQWITPEEYFKNI